MPKYVIEVDPNEATDWDGSDSSAYDSDTTSLASSIRHHVFENGRRFHGWHQGTYAMPNDEEEQERMDLQHFICLLSLNGRLYKSPPLKEPTRILDIGTGNGIWAIECGELHLEAEVIGVDLSPIQPRWVPENVTFEVDDIELVWSYEENSFDMIHIRQLSGFIADWPRLFKQALRILKPGGVIELQDYLDFESHDGTLPADSSIVEWNKMWRDGFRSVGRELPSEEFAPMLTEAGFENVTYEPVMTPVGTWPIDKAEKEVGFYMRQHMLDGCESLSLAIFTRFLGWSKEDLDALLTKVRQEFKNPKYHICTTFHVTYAWKPL